MIRLVILALCLAAAMAQWGMAMGDMGMTGGMMGGMTGGMMGGMGTQCLRQVCQQMMMGGGGMMGGRGMMGGMGGMGMMGMDQAADEAAAV